MEIITQALELWNMVAPFIKSPVGASVLTVLGFFGVYRVVPTPPLTKFLGSLFYMCGVGTSFFLRRKFGKKKGEMKERKFELILYECYKSYRAGLDSDEKK